MKRFVFRIKNIKNMTNVLMTIGVRAHTLIITPEWAKGPIQLVEGCETAAREDRVIQIDFDF